MPIRAAASFLALVSDASPAEWMVEAGFWIAVASLLGLGATAIGVWTLVSRVRELREEEKRLVILGEIEKHLARMNAQRDDLDMRRVEHVLIDIRDGFRRLEQNVLEAQSHGPSGEVVTNELMVPVAPQNLVERITNRLLAQGFTQVQVLTSEDELQALVHEEGAAIVEARRNGVLYKGSARLRQGRIDGVDMNPTYSIFP